MVRMEKRRANMASISNEKKNEYQRRYREKHKNKYRAHQIVSRAIKSGKITKESCCECGSIINVHAHHDDYDRPMDIIWLCVRHHKERHRKVE